MGAGGGFSSLVVRSLQLFHPLVGKQLSSAICQSANRGQIRGLLSWCCCYCCSPSGSKFNEHKNTVLCNHFAEVNLFSYDFTTRLFQLAFWWKFGIIKKYLLPSGYLFPKNCLYNFLFRIKQTTIILFRIQKNLMKFQSALFMTLNLNNLEQILRTF